MDRRRQRLSRRRHLSRRKVFKNMLKILYVQSRRHSFYVWSGDVSEKTLQEVTDAVGIAETASPECRLQLHKKFKVKCAELCEKSEVAKKYLTLLEPRLEAAEVTFWSRYAQSSIAEHARDRFRHINHYIREIKNSIDLYSMYKSELEEFVRLWPENPSDCSTSSTTTSSDTPNDHTITMNSGKHLTVSLV